MYYGRHRAASLRLLLAVAGPAAACVYGLSRFTGTGFPVTLMTFLIASKALGVLMVAGVARTAFGQPFEVPIPGRWTRRSRADRVGEFTRSLLTAAAWIACGLLVVASIDDAYGTGRLAAMGRPQAAAVIVGLAGVLAVRSIMFVSERHAPGASVGRTLLLGLLLRCLMVLPLALLLFEATRQIGIVLSIFWLPMAALAALWLSYGVERRALAEIDPSLDVRQSRASVPWNELIGSSFVVAVAACVLFVICMAGLEYCLLVVGIGGFLLGPVSEYLVPEFFDPGLAATLISHNPLFAATCVVAGLFAYQLARVAWFFTYLDARVRRDCWDLELQLAREARRLEGG